MGEGDISSVIPQLCQHFKKMFCTAFAIEISETVVMTHKTGSRCTGVEIIENR